MQRRAPKDLAGENGQLPADDLVLGLAVAGDVDPVHVRRDALGNLIGDVDDGVLGPGLVYDSRIEVPFLHVNVLKRLQIVLEFVGVEFARAGEQGENPPLLGFDFPA